MKFPDMRHNFEVAVAELASEEIQREIWPDPPPFCGFDLVVHILFDDINIVETPEWESSLGISSSQAAQVRKIMGILEQLWAKFGVECDHEILRAQPEWRTVVSIAQQYMNSSEISPAFRSHLMSSKSYGEKFVPVNPFACLDKDHE